MQSDVRRAAPAAIAAAALLVGTGCSAGGGTSPGEGTSAPAISHSTPGPPESPEPTRAAEARKPTTPKPGRTRGVTCLRVDDAVAGDIAAGSNDPLTPVPGTSVAYRPSGSRGSYLVVMVFTGPGRPEPRMGVWAVQRPIDSSDHGPISSVDRIARGVTSWPVAPWIVEDDFRVSEARACTLS